MTSFNSRAKGARIAVALLLMVTVLLSTGCVTPPPWIWQSPALTTDGAGGAIVFYAIEQDGQRQFFGQRVDKEGNPQWGREGVLIGKDYTKDPFALDIVGDEAGGAILVWRAVSKMRAEGYGVYVARVSPQGEILWQRQFLRMTAPVPGGFRRMPLRVTSDGAGGVIIGWCDPELHVNIQRIGPDGQFLWGEGGLRLSQEPLAPPRAWPGITFDAVVNEQGEVIFVWAPQVGRIFAQKISPEGEVLWTERGVEVGIPQRETWAQVASDGTGGAIITWSKDLYESGSRYFSEVLAQRIDDRGNIVWQQPGISLFKERSPIEPVPRIVSVEAGEVIITYQSLAALYAQKIDIEGNFQWQGQRVRVSSFCIISGPEYQIVGDDAGGAILVFRYHDRGLGRTVFGAQRIDAEGNLLWPEQLSVTTDRGGPYSISPDGGGGVFVAWVEARRWGPFLSHVRYIQRISGEGERMLGDKGYIAIE